MGGDEGDTDVFTVVDGVVKACCSCGSLRYAARQKMQSLILVVESVGAQMFFFVAGTLGADACCCTVVQTVMIFDVFLSIFAVADVAALLLAFWR